MEPAVRAVPGNVRIEAGGRLKPVVEVMAWHASALLVEVVSVAADILLAERGRNQGLGGLVLHG
jgi:hypothetical protein